MKLVTVRYYGQTRFGALVDEQIVDINRSYEARLEANEVPDAAARAAVDCPPEAIAFLTAGENAVRSARAAIDWGLSQGEEAYKQGLVIQRASGELLSPIPRPGKILCIGLNYAEHATETNLERHEVPTVFLKLPGSVVGPGAGIEKPEASNELDYEVELAVVIGRRGRAISETEAMDYVAGYTVLNDVSVRDYQMRTGQWTIGKIFDTHCPVGPVLVTSDEVSDPHHLEIASYLNGTRMQQSNTRFLIFRVPQLISYLSRAVTLEPGDIIATGTPEGVGFTRNPPVYLKVGDTISCEVEQIGRLENTVIPQAGL